MEKVSIIIPVYNSERFISQCIESILNQTYKNIEIIIVNDGSTDNSYEICKAYEKENKNIILISIENSGVSTARNIGLDHATGSYITFVDSDDWAEPNMIEFAIKKIKEKNADIVLWSYFKNFPDRELELPLLSEEDQIFTSNKDFLFLKSIDAMYKQDKSMESVSAGTVWCKLYSRELLYENNLRFNPILTRAQDTIFSMSAFKYANKIAYFNKSLYHYRISDTSTSSGNRYIEDTVTPFNELLKEFISFSKYVRDQTEFEKVMNVRTVKVLGWHLEHKYFHPQFEGSIIKRRKLIKKIKEDKLYKASLKKVDVSLLARKEKVMAYLLRNDFILLCYFIFLLNKYIRRRKVY